MTTQYLNQKLQDLQTNGLRIDPVKAIFEIAKVRQQIEEETAYINLNNLYLSIEVGRVVLTHRVYNQLQDLLHTFERYGSQMHEWWWKEFQKLPGWLNV